MKYLCNGMVGKLMNRTSSMSSLFSVCCRTRVSTSVWNSPVTQCCSQIKRLSQRRVKICMREELNVSSFFNVSFLVRTTNS